MLSRTASNLYWMARYMERMENTARILDVTYRMSLMPQSAQFADQEWFAPLNITGTLYPFFYSLVSRAVNGGTFVANLPPGTGEEALFGLFTLGALSTIAATVYGFWALLKS